MIAEKIMFFLIRRKLPLIIAMLVIPVAAGGYEEVEDLVEIFVIDRDLVAIVDGRSRFVEAMRSDEKVLWQGAKGEIGAFLTTDRLLAVSITSGQWNSRYLKISEKKSGLDMLLAAHLVLMLSDERVLAFGTHTGGFFQVRLPVGEAVLAKAAKGRVAAVATASFAYGFSTYRRGVSEFRFRRDETLVSLKATYNKITMQTSDRVVSLDAEDAVWRTFELP